MKENFESMPAAREACYESYDDSYEKQKTARISENNKYFGILGYA